MLRKAFGDSSLARIAPHVTLVPPVNVASEDVPAAIEAVDAAAATAEPFRLELGPPATFLPATAVLYLKVGGPEARAALATVRATVFAAPLARPVSRRFEPHVTIGRSRKDPRRIEAAIEAFAAYRADVTVDRLTLVELLQPDRSPAIWTPIHQAPLGGPVVVARGPMQLELTTTSVISDDAMALLAGETPHQAAAGEGVPRSWDAERQAQRDPPPDQVVVTARRGRELLGVLVGRQGGGDTAVDAVVVDPAHRRQGVAGHLLRQFSPAR